VLAGLVMFTSKMPFKQTVANATTLESETEPQMPVSEPTQETVRVPVPDQYQGVYHDEISGREVYHPIPGKVNMYITVTAEAAVSELGYSVGGEMVRVGKFFSLQCPELQCYGYCIKLDVEQ